jgi:hypothetical protein
LQVKKKPAERVRGPRSRSKSETEFTHPVTAKLTPLLKRKVSSLGMASYMTENATLFGSAAEDVLEAAEKMKTCGGWLMLREYIETGNVRLLRAIFCKKRNLCTMCDAANARRVYADLVPKVLSLKGQHMHSYMLTLTVKNGPDLLGLIDLIFKSLRKIWNRKKSGRGNGPLRHVYGMVVCLEITRNKTTGHWHPHAHCLVTCLPGRWVAAAEMRQEWLALTGADQIDLKPMINVEKGMLEMIKYMLKPGDLYPDGSKNAGNSLSKADRVEAWLLLRNKRLRFSYGIYQGFLSDLLTESELDGDYFDWIARWVAGGYSYWQERTGSIETAKRVV